MTAAGRIEFGGYQPGTLGQVLDLMTAQYCRSHGAGLPFELRMATAMAEFLRKYDPRYDLFLIPRLRERVAGSLAVEADHDPRNWAHCAGSCRARSCAAAVLAGACSPTRSLSAATPASRASISRRWPGSTPRRISIEARAFG